MDNLTEPMTDFDTPLVVTCKSHIATVVVQALGHFNPPWAGKRVFDVIGGLAS